MKSNDILTPEVIEEIPLEKTIENTLVKNNVTDQVIAELKSNYGGLKLRDIEDKEMYLEIKQAQKNTRKIGILVEKLCKKGREDAIAIQKRWLSKEKEVLAKIAEVENPLQAEIDRFDAEVERKETAAAQRREESYMKRQSTLLKMGATYDNGSFVLNHISYEINLIKESGDDIWAETILPKYQREYEKNEAVRVDEENKREEAATKMKAEREALEEQQRQFKEQQEAFAKQQEQLRQQQIEAEKVQRDAAERERIFKAQQEEKLWRSRLSELTDIGWNGQYAFDRANDEVPIFTYDQLVSLPEKEFNAMRDGYNYGIAARKEKEREIREAQIAEQQKIAAEAAAQREREKIAEEQRQQKLKEEQEAQRKAEELLKATDKEKWAAWLFELTGVRMPEMKHYAYKKRIEDAKMLLSKIVNLS